MSNYYLTHFKTAMNPAKSHYPNHFGNYAYMNLIDTKNSMNWDTLMDKKPIIFFRRIDITKTPHVRMNDSVRNLGHTMNTIGIKDHSYFSVCVDALMMRFDQTYSKNYYYQFQFKMQTDTNNGIGDLKSLITFKVADCYPKDNMGYNNIGSKVNLFDIHSNNFEIKNNTH